MDNLNHPGLVIGHLVEAISENLFAGNFLKLPLRNQGTDQHPGWLGIVLLDSVSGETQLGLSPGLFESFLLASPYNTLTSSVLY